MANGNPFYEYEQTPYVPQYAPYPVEQYGKAATMVQDRADQSIAAWNQLDVLSANFKDQLGENDQHIADEARKIIDDELGELVAQKKWFDIDYLLPEVYKKAIGKNRDLTFSMQQYKKIKEGELLRQEYGAEGIDFNDPKNHRSVVVDPQTGEKQYIPYTLDVKREAKHSLIAQQLLAGMPQESIQQAFVDQGEGWEESITTSGISRARVNRVAKETVDAFKDADPQYLKVEAHKLGINVAGMSGDEAEAALIDYYDKQGMNGQAMVDENVYNYIRKANEKLISTSTGISSRQSATSRGDGSGSDKNKYNGIYEKEGFIDVADIAKSQKDLDNKIVDMRREGNDVGADFLQRQKDIMLNTFISQNPKYADIYKNKPTSGDEYVDALVADIMNPDALGGYANWLGNIIDWQYEKSPLKVVTGKERIPRARTILSNMKITDVGNKVAKELVSENLSQWLGRDVSEQEAKKIKDYAMKYYSWQNSGGIKMNDDFDEFIDSGEKIQDVVQVFEDPDVAKDITYHIQQMNLSQLGNYDIVSSKTNKELKNKPINPRDLQYVGMSFGDANNPPEIEVFDTKELDPEKQIIRLTPRTNDDGLVNFIFEHMGEVGQVQAINYKYYNEKITKPIKIAPGISIVPMENSLTTFYLERDDKADITIGDHIMSLMPSPDDKEYNRKKKYASYKYNEYLIKNQWDGTDAELQKIMESTLTGGKELIGLAQDIYRANLKK